MSSRSEPPAENFAHRREKSIDPPTFAETANLAGASSKKAGANVLEEGRYAKATKSLSPAAVIFS